MPHIWQVRQQLPAKRRQPARIIRNIHAGQNNFLVSIVNQRPRVRRNPIICKTDCRPAQYPRDAVSAMPIAAIANLHESLFLHFFICRDYWLATCGLRYAIGIRIEFIPIRNYSRADKIIGAQGRAASGYEYRNAWILAGNLAELLARLAHRLMRDGAGVYNDGGAGIRRRQHCANLFGFKRVQTASERKNFYGLIFHFSWVIITAQKIIAIKGLIMARITISDDLPFVHSKYELGMLAGQRVRDLNGGESPVIPVNDNDKPSVTALREIASGKLDIEALRAEFVQSYKKLPVADDSVETLESDADAPELKELDEELAGLAAIKQEIESTDEEPDETSAESEDESGAADDGVENT